MLKFSCIRLIGNEIKLREVRKTLTTTLFSKDYKGTRLIAVPNGKKVRDVTIGNPQPSSSLIFAPLCGE